MQVRSQARLRKCNVTDRVLGEYLAKLGTSRALSVWLLYRAGEHQQLVALDLPLDVWDHLGGLDLVRRSYAATKCLLKSDFLKLGIDRKQVALDGGLAAEEKNRQTNQFLLSLRSGRINDPEFNETLRLAARFVGKVLGPLSSALRGIHDYGWTPGRSSAVSRDSSSSLEKYQANLEVSSGALPFARCLVQSSPLWSNGRKSFTIVDHNTAMTVPKNAKTDRLICYEPHLNIRLQRSVGAWIQGRLKKFGVDLADQKPNQVLARRGSRWGTHATIDLSMASDTLARELVQDLLPMEWENFLNQLRSQYTKWPDGRVLRNEKFSSMGNGFTFELETLCFLSIVKACTTRRVLVYGDDIVVPTRDYSVVVSALSKAGFSVNSAKSFSTGLFRESCGEDYYRGVSLKAPRLEKVCDTYQVLQSFHNRVFEWLLRGNSVHVSWARTLKRWRRESLSWFQIPFIPLVSQELGDVGFFCNFDEASPPRNKRGWDGFDCRGLIPVRYFPRGKYELVLTPQGFKEDWASAALAAALGPRPPLKLLDSLGKVNLKVVRRSSVMFARTWPSVLYVD